MLNNTNTTEIYAVSGSNNKQSIVNVDINMNDSSVNKGNVQQSLHSNNKYGAIYVKLIFDIFAIPVSF